MTSTASVKFLRVLYLLFFMNCSPNYCCLPSTKTAATAFTLLFIRSLPPKSRGSGHLVLRFEQIFPEKLVGLVFFFDNHLKNRSSTTWSPERKKKRHRNGRKISKHRGAGGSTAQNFEIRQDKCLRRHAQKMFSAEQESGSADFI